MGYYDCIVFGMIARHISCSNFSYGFVEFEDAATAEKIMTEYQGMEVDNFIIDLEFSKPSPVPSKTLFVSNLTNETSTITLKKLFPQATRVHVAMNRFTNNSKG